MTEKPGLKLFFEWGGGTLWCDNNAARALLDVGPVENRLPLSPKTRAALAELSVLHDTALNWDIPTGPLLWTKSQIHDFNQQALSLLAALQSELGTLYEIHYDPCPEQLHLPSSSN